MKTCVICGGTLKGKQSKYCSRLCKNRCTNTQHQSYKAQQARGRRRKRELIRLKGGKCSLCGYRRNSSALEFHHSSPQLKSFALDLRALSNRKWQSVLEEARKCALVCSNCHKELHNPDCSIG